VKGNDPSQKALARERAALNREIKELEARLKEALEAASSKSPEQVVQIINQAEAQAQAIVQHASGEQPKQAPQAEPEQQLAIEPSTALVPSPGGQIVPAKTPRTKGPMKNVTPVNEFYSAFNRAINNFKSSSRNTPIERANKIN
jgi:hypothetical protein